MQPGIAKHLYPEWNFAVVTPVHCIESNNPPTKKKEAQDLPRTSSLACDKIFTPQLYVVMF